MEMLSLFLIIAGVFGAAGIALAAAGAHAAPSAGLDSDANILLFHALAILGGKALLLQSTPISAACPDSSCSVGVGHDPIFSRCRIASFCGATTFSDGRADGRNYLDSSLAGLAAAALAKAFDHSA
jgi:hypothetical protein